MNQPKHNLPPRVLSTRGHQLQIQTTIPKIVSQSPEGKAPSTQDNQVLTLNIQLSILL